MLKNRKLIISIALILLSLSAVFVLIFSTNNNCGDTACSELPFEEDCIVFDPDTSSIENVNEPWVIVDAADTVILDFASSESEALEAIDIIKHYMMDSICFVGRPEPDLTYLLVDNTAPEGAYPDEDCIDFELNAIVAERINGRWKIAEENHMILDFDQNEQEAKQAFRIIQHYSFDHICFVGRPNASLTYFRR